MGSAPARSTVFTPYAEEVIKHKARQIARRTDQCRSDEDDFAQEMRRHLLSRFHHFDSKRSCYSTFVARVIDSWIASLLRERRRHKRAAARESLSLEGSPVVSDGAKTTLREALSANRLAGCHADGPVDELVRKELIAAVARVVGSLPPLLRDICARLPEQSQVDIKRELGLSRRQFDSAMARIRKIFADARLGQSADTSAQDGVRNQQGSNGLGLEESGE
ncbi:MAG: hypothetical protein KKI02_02420 [Planctomycetes bacterium]|nr:hypothetical protein [Planctomycetota bacterium]